MKGQDMISDEHLNAFVDGQLDADEKSRVFSAINEDEALNTRACELRKLRELVRHAYDLPPAPAGKPRHGRGIARGLQRGMAAGLLLGMGVAGGWYGRAHVERDQVQAMFLDSHRTFETTALTNIDQIAGARKVILHISSSNPQRIEEGLKMAQHLLETYKEKHEKGEVEVVANAGGLNLLRAGVSPFAGQVKRLQEQYSNLAFMACQTAINKLEREKGVKVKLLPQALLTPSALEEVLNRLQDGWVYVKV